MAATHADRWWVGQAAAETRQSIDELCARLLAYGYVDCERFVERRHRKRALFLHARLALHTADGMRPFYVLCDHDYGSLWQRYAMLKYLNRWASRTVHDPFPALLITAPHAYRAEGLLLLNRMAGGSVTAYAAVDAAPLRWHALRADGVFVRADPLAAPAWRSADYLASVHRVRPEPARRRPKHRPPHLAKLGAVKRLTPEARRVLRWLARHPVCPASIVAWGLEMQVPEVLNVLEVLKVGGLAHPVRGDDRERLWMAVGELPRSHPHVRVWRAVRGQGMLPVTAIARQLSLASASAEHAVNALAAEGALIAADDLPPHALWRASDDAVGVLAGQHMLDPEVAIRRHRFFCADHLRRAQHTRTAYAFFEALLRECVQRSAARRHFDATGTLNEGDIPHFELTRIESELTASDWYVAGGQARVWRPDGFAVLRASAAYWPFYVEIDGTPWSRARRTAALWEAKFGALCDYILSRHWRLRTRAFPRLLIVTTDALNRRPIGIGLIAAARSRGIAVPQVYVTTHAALAQRGVLQPIWFRADGDGRQATHAFDLSETP